MDRLQHYPEALLALQPRLDGVQREERDVRHYARGAARHQGRQEARVSHGLRTCFLLGYLSTISCLRYSHLSKSSTLQ